MRPRLLRPDNFTPPSRTPWGGQRILGHYKKALDIAAAGPAKPVGESWEISVEPSFPSRFADDDALLSEAIADDPPGWLGDTARAGRTQTGLLVKLVDAAENLSVQVHPATGDPALADDESGKPESWYILDATAGAGLYLGFRDGVDRSQVELCLRDGGRLDALMNFVPVARGDAFLIRAGTVHSIGAGVTLVEPQFVSPGRRGITYRYWDWNRHYDDDGRRCTDGRMRPLHIERALAVTDWAGERGERAVSACRARPEVLQDGDLARIQAASWRYFTVERWVGSGTLVVPALDTLLAVVCVRGSGAVHGDFAAHRIQCGQSMVIPADAGALEVSGNDLELIVTREA